MNNRPIKFRAWDRVKSRMTTDFLIYSDGEILRDKGNTDDGGIAYSKPGEQMQPNGTFLSNLELMQFTGLTDKNGKDVYEGDILAWSIHHCEVTYWRDGFSAFSHSEGKEFGVFALLNQGAEAIGNIYENPELLTN